MNKYLIILSVLTIFLIGFLYEREIIFLSSDEKIKVIQNIENENQIDIIIDSDENELSKIDLEKIENISKIEIDGKEYSKDEVKDKSFVKGTIISVETNKNKEDIENIINENIITEEKIIEEKEEIIGETNIDLIKNNYSSNINNLIEFSGENLENIEYITIGEISYKPNIEDNKAYVLINKGSYNTGEYFIIFQEINGKINYLNKKISFTYSNQKINIADITPNKINNNQNNYIVLQGEGFDKVIRIQLSNNIVLEETNFNIINKNVLSVLIPKGINPGEYYLNIMDIDGIYKSTKKITINN